MKNVTITENSIRFSLNMKSADIDRFKKMIDTQNTDNSNLPIFTLQQKDPDTKEVKRFQNLLLIGLKFRCLKCDYNLRINQHVIAKRFKARKSLDLKEVKDHVMNNVGHEIEVSQSFEKYVPKIQTTV